MSWKTYPESEAPGPKVVLKLANHVLTVRPGRCSAECCQTQRRSDKDEHLFASSSSALQTYNNIDAYDGHAVTFCHLHNSDMFHQRLRGSELVVNLEATQHIISSLVRE